ncbi:MAG TPA: 3' terminal RNA ribose 2'-O-methyltransferase Hen1 [Planctomycetota bacterium]|nr:3' terminal RNA ribose 2'-O-methyltransferase Hen1 [Planctomycetota bacterium]
MLLTLTCTTAPATDLGYLLHKNPSRAHEFDLSFGKAHVFYPEARDERCTAALMLEVDPVGLVRNRKGPSGEGRSLEQYVNDRPYVASSFLCVALSEVFRTALSGRSKDRPELAERAIALEARISVVPCREGEPLLRKLFEPLGYAVATDALPLDEANPAWGASRYFAVTLTAEKRLCDLLAHLYVLLPVLDDDKHYWVGDDEVEKLVRRGEGWLAAHPERELIAKRYLRHQRGLAREALEQLLAEELPEVEVTQAVHAREEVELEKRISLREHRIAAVVAELRACGARRVLDLGCGEGQLLRALMAERSFESIVGVDVSHRALEQAAARMRLERMPDAQRERLQLWHGSLTYRDKRLTGFDAAAVVEVIEHLDPPRLTAFERAVFEFAKPRVVVVTTPNAEYNAKFEGLPAGRFRHKDHRFEWSRRELESWARGLAERFGYGVRFQPIGPVDPLLGAPTQMAVFTR